MLKQLKRVCPFCIFLVFGLLVWLLWPGSIKETNKSVSEGSARVSATDSDPGKFENKVLSADVSQDLISRLRGELELLKQVHGEVEGQQAIHRMQNWLNSSPGAAGAIVSVLETGQDAFAFGRFAPGADGFLNSYPTFRTALLDSLEKLDPQAAVRVSKQILNTSENADEWALSLRTLTRHAFSAEDLDFRNGKVSELLAKEVWLSEPTFSFLHAFDVVAATGQTASLQRLGDLVSDPPNRAVGHAATLSVDRFFQSHDLIGAHHLVSSPEFLQSNTGFRATLMARVDPRNETGTKALNTYLQTEAVSENEKRVFLESFPNFNSTFAFNLLTGSLLLSSDEMRDRSLAAKAQLEAWQESDLYSQFEDTISSRLKWLGKTWKVEL